MNQKNSRLNLSDIILTGVLVILILSMSDLTAGFITKIPIIRTIPIFIWGKPEGMSMAIILMILLITYLKFREYGPRRNKG